MIKANVHRSIGEYEFVEYELSFNVPAEVEEFIAEAKKQRLKEKYECAHLFAKEDSGISKKTNRPWTKETCPECLAIRWKDGTSWGSWQFQKKGDK